MCPGCRSVLDLTTTGQRRDPGTRSDWMVEEDASVTADEQFGDLAADGRESLGDATPFSL